MQHRPAKGWPTSRTQSSISWRGYRSATFARTKLVFFGQCATGADWQGKLNELQPVDFCKTWLIEQPAMNPSLAFFVPRHITDDHWPTATLGDRRLVFDRLRIALLSHEIDEALAHRCAAWTASTLA